MFFSTTQIRIQITFLMKLLSTMIQQIVYIYKLDWYRDRFSGFLKSSLYFL